MILTGLLSSGSSAADQDGSFSTMLDAALSRYGNYGDVLGSGGASAGSRFASSVNPASTAARNDSIRRLSISPQDTSIEHHGDAVMSFQRFIGDPFAVVS